MGVHVEWHHASETRADVETAETDWVGADGLAPGEIALCLSTNDVSAIYGQPADLLALADRIVKAVRDATGEPEPRRDRTAYRFTYADLDRVVGRTLTDEEVAQITRALANSTIGECVDAAVEQVVGLEEDDEDPGDFPTDTCGCGYPLTYYGKDGGWQHDAAPYLWRDDHNAHPDGNDAADRAAAYDAAQGE